MATNLQDIIIIGSGPAGLTAAIYAVRGGLNTLVLGGSRWGGQLMLTTTVENFPGFPDGVQGPQLMTAMKQQAERLGVIIISHDVTEVNFSQKPFRLIANKEEYQGKSVIVAAGATDRWLGVPGETQLIGRGVSSCAPCDAAFFKDKEVIVVGGGDSAMEEAGILTKFASGVTLVHRRDAFRASKIMQDHVLGNLKVKTILNAQVTAIRGSDKVTAVKLKDNQHAWEMPIDGVFVAIGHDPATKIFTGKLEMDEKGYIQKIRSSIRQPADEIRNDQGTVIGNKYQMMTSVEGVFVAGDVHDSHYRQAITAAGYGCQAALEVIRWLEEQKG